MSEDYNNIRQAVEILVNDANMAVYDHNYAMHFWSTSIVNCSLMKLFAALNTHSTEIDADYFNITDDEDRSSSSDIYNVRKTGWFVPSTIDYSYKEIEIMNFSRKFDPFEIAIMEEFCKQTGYIISYIVTDISSIRVAFILPTL